MDDENRYKDEGGDRKYYVIVPQIVLALSRDPYDFTLWVAIKMIAGENGECWIGVRQLAELCGMSAGKVHDCRTFLMSIGLLRGHLEKRNTTRHPVWHLSVPDIWEWNIEWRKEHDKISERIAFKKKFHARLEPMAHYMSL